MHHARPITILSSLYRLFGKFIFKVTANIWKDFFPYDISGGLPGRGVKEFAYSQKRAVEESLASGSGIGGYSLDLIKAYSTFGRYIVARILHRLGIPKAFVDARLSSLDKMVRYPSIQGCVTNGIPATTGVPESCSISVLAMLATSCLFHAFLKSERVRPFAYADTWSWIVTEQREHVMAYQRTLRLTDCMKLTIDHLQKLALVKQKSPQGFVQDYWGSWQWL